MKYVEFDEHYESYEGEIEQQTGYAQTPVHLELVGSRCDEESCRASELGGIVVDQPGRPDDYGSAVHGNRQLGLDEPRQTERQQDVQCVAAEGVGYTHRSDTWTHDILVK